MGACYTHPGHGDQQCEAAPEAPELIRLLLPTQLVRTRLQERPQRLELHTQQGGSTAAQHTADVKLLPVEEDHNSK